MTDLQLLWMVIVLALGTMITRFLPFFLFPPGKEVPAFVEYLGKHLPYAAIGLLVVYCLKDLTFSVYPNAVPETLAVVLVILLHWWKRNSLLSIGGGTALYMVLVQLVFV